MLAIKAAGLKLDEISELIHGSTVATNAVLERKGRKSLFFCYPRNKRPIVNSTA